MIALSDDGRVWFAAPCAIQLDAGGVAAGTRQHCCRPRVATEQREELRMARPAKIASAQLLQEVQRAAVRQGYETLVCIYLETLCSPRTVDARCAATAVDGRHGPTAGWVVLLEAAAAYGGPPVKLSATVTVLSGARHIAICDARASTLTMHGEQGTGRKTALRQHVTGRWWIANYSHAVGSSVAVCSMSMTLPRYCPTSSRLATWPTSG